MDRRKFIILTGVGATSAGMLTACGHPEEKLIPALIPDEEYVPGIDYWKASACGMCAAGCGILVRTREHKANKIEGNPLHPVNRGALCARGQAGLQLLYNPDRIRGPVRRTGERGSGQFEEISWDEAIKTLADKLREIKSQGQSNTVSIATDRPRSASWITAMHLMAEYGSSWLISSPAYNEVGTVSGYSRSYGRQGPPTFDIGNATYLLSFGARFLETWLSPVMYSLAYGEFRRSQGKARGRFVHIEPRMSLTAANADEWIPALPGSNDLVALALAQVIVREGLAREPLSSDLTFALEEYAPEKTYELSDVPAERVIRIAREFASSERPLAVASGAGTRAALSVEKVNLLNTLVGNWNKPGGMFLPPPEEFRPLEPLIKTDNRGLGIVILLENALREKKINALLVHQFNPVYFAPRMLNSIREVPFIASFSSFMDETTELADLILPDNTYLESWDIVSTEAINIGRVASITQPVIKSEFNTRQTADVLIGLARELGLNMPFESSEDIVRRAVAEIAKIQAVEGDEKIEEFWNTIAEKGVWFDVTKPAQNEIQPAVERLKSRIIGELPYLKSYKLKKKEEEEQSSSEYTMTLMVYEHATLGDGSFANLPWLQELPDPMTSVMWGSWVEINPKTAESLGIADGDVVEVTTPHGSVRAPAVLYPAIRPDVVAMPYGQGHAGFGRYASGRGVNVIELNPYSSNPDNRSDTVQVKVTKVADGSDQIRFGTMLPEHIHVKR